MIQLNKDFAFVTESVNEAHINVPNPKYIKRAIELHLQNRSRLSKLYNYYIGKQDILNREQKDPYLPNNRAVYNNAKNITDTSVGYVFGQPIQYNNLPDEVMDLFTVINEDTHNVEMGINMSIYGKAIELLYCDTEVYGENKVVPNLVALDPLNSFVVYDTSLSPKPVMGIVYGENRDLDDTLVDYSITVYTEDINYQYRVKTLDSVNYRRVGAEVNQFDGIPMIEVYNNKYETGDFECVLGLLDAYNLLMNDRVNDKESFVNSLLVLTGMNIGDTESEASATGRWINENGMVICENDNADAKYISRTLTESDVEVLRKAIVEDIHMISMIPNMTDENFASGQSGEAMQYKLLGFENLAKKKEQQFKELLRKRLKVMNGLPIINIDLPIVDIKMNRALPVSLDDRLKELQGTDGYLSLETRLRNYDPDLDIDEEMKRIAKEKEEKNKQMATAYGNYNFPLDNKPIGQNVSEEDKEMKDTEEEKDTEDTEE